MTRRYFFFPLFFLFGFIPALQAQDTLWVQQRDNMPYLLHKVKRGEDLFLIAKRYSVPPAALADRNDVTYQDGLRPGRQFQIPVDKYNYIRIESVVNSRPLYYRAEEEDNLHSVSRMFNVSQGTIQRWNHMDDAAITPNEVLLVGWIAYDVAQKPLAPVAGPLVKQDTPLVLKTVKPKPGILVPKKDTVMKNNITAEDTDDEEREESALEKQFKEENGSINLTEESGAAVFYTLKSAPGGLYYAFHNMARKGSVIKIMNPANHKIIFAKVIGPIPKLKEYHNAILGLSSNAAQALGAQDKRMFCKLKYR